MLSILNVDMHRVVEPGIFDIMVGPSSAETQQVALEVVGPTARVGPRAARPRSVTVYIEK